MHAPHALRASRRIPSLLIVAAAALAACATHAAAQQPVSGRVVVESGGDMVLVKSDEAAPPGNSTVRGRAVFEETGRPVRRARVMLVLENSTPGAGVAAQGLTNARGEFEFKGVRAGRYFVAVFAPGVLTPFSFGLTTVAAVDSTPMTVGWGGLAEVKKYLDEVVVDAATDAEVTVRARRGGAISGRVTYEDGSPAVSASVSLYRKTGGKLARAQATEQADDRGVYRFTALAPGDYVVGVTELVLHGDAGMGRASAALYAGGGGALFSTYYPSATDIRAATVLSVGAGEEREGADVSIVERELHTVAGRVRSRANSKPVAGARVTVSDANAPPELAGYAAAMPDAVTDERGRFTLREIPAGDYVITVRPAADVDATELLTPQPRATPKPTPAADDEEEGDEDVGYRAPLQRYTVKEQQLKIAGADVDDLDIALESGAFVAGTILFEGGKGEPSYVNVRAVKVGESASAEDDGGTYFDGQFAIGGLSPGRYFLSVGAADEEGGEYYVKAMTCNGTDLTREPLRVEAGATLRCVRVVLAKGTGTLKGRVLTDAERKPVLAANIFAVPADAAKWQTPDGQSQVASEMSGKFEMELPPGDYLVFALPPGGSQGQTLTPDEIKAHAARALRVTVRAKLTTNAELTLRDGN
ncbi:MAG: carboxypeptidase-like regulatory domain-containing protein [Acidobacteria bacterium]|nr:carboxypeptidase-like regulatory domain-containing protein [Acidobacteriota bacterium]